MVGTTSVPHNVSGASRTDLEAPRTGNRVYAHPASKASQVRKVSGLLPAGEIVNRESSSSSCHCDALKVSPFVAHFRSGWLAL